MPVSVAKAIARISGGLYIVTAVKGSSKGAMVASWVAQVRGRGKMRRRGDMKKGGGLGSTGWRGGEG